MFVADVPPAPSLDATRTLATRLYVLHGALRSQPDGEQPFCASRAVTAATDGTAEEGMLAAAVAAALGDAAVDAGGGPD